jgi:hypothetical protein
MTGRIHLPPTGQSDPLAGQLTVGQNVCMTDPEIDHGRLGDLQGELRHLLNK